MQPVILVYKDGQRYQFESGKSKEKLESWVKRERYTALQPAQGRHTNNTVPNNVFFSAEYGL